ncbi:MAG: hypothetical protein D6781_10920 [Verrucomicrobia bacterium]|nr:MAG: hypothetical protein D6781_10920 [Verrucomicrobiota bacterium]
MYVRGEAGAGLASGDSFWAVEGDATLLDAGMLVRPRLAGTAGALDGTLEVDLSSLVGDRLERLGGGGAIPGVGPATGARDLFDLRWTASEGRRHRTVVRVDRLSVRYSADWGAVSVGRQAVTWGGGLVFNSFDLFNPFAPSDVVRDFKVGADMVYVDVPLRDGGLQVLAVGRRDLFSGEATLDAASFAALYKRRVGAWEGALMLAEHYGEPVAGVGLDGALGEAVWHVDGTWVRVRPDLPGGGDPEGYFSAVANVQYAWILGGKNAYGFVEYYYNGLGTTDYPSAYRDPIRLTQLARGNVFVLGRHFAAVSVQLEWHPLLHLYFGALANLEDPSGLLQPRVWWDASEHVRMIFGLDVPFGARGMEFGGFRLPAVEGMTRSPARAYVLATVEF